MAFSNPTAIVAMALGELLAAADSAVIDFDDKAVGEYDSLLQELAEFAKTIAERSRKVQRVPID